MPQLFWNTVDAQLQTILLTTMEATLFKPFRLVGGTALSLQLGHRRSVDIDLFTDAAYDSIDFDALDAWFRARHAYVSDPTGMLIALGRSYLMGESPEHAVKVDIYYTDPFIREPLLAEGIRMATAKEIAAMKVNVIQRGGRKKDFWDIHALLDQFTIDEMISLHAERYPYDHDEQLIKGKFTDFTRADDDLDPICLRGNYWEFIKLDLLELMS